MMTLAKEKVGQKTPDYDILFKKVDGLLAKPTDLYHFSIKRRECQKYPMANTVNRKDGQIQR